MGETESTDPDEMHGVRWDGYRVDVVFDTVGGERLRRSPAVLRAGGRIVSVAEEPPDGGVYFIVAANHDQLRSEALAAGVRDKPETAIGTMLTEHSRSDRARLRQT